MTDTALHVLRQRWPHARPRVGLVLGSGWGGVTDRVQDATRIAYADLPGFPVPGVHGHAGELVWGRLGPHQVAVLTGRQHTYETGRCDGMKDALRTLRDWGCEVLVQTNAAGSLCPDMPTGRLMWVSDHLNLPQRSPLVGEAGNGRFVSMVDAYDPGLRAQALAVAQAQGAVAHQGVYAWFLGPQFETPAEIRMAILLGAHAVGMSTVPETILARHLGLKVLAVSLVTNMAAGLSGEVLSHAHTLAQAQRAADHASRVLTAVVENLTW